MTLTTRLALAGSLLCLPVAAVAQEREPADEKAVIEELEKALKSKELDVRRDAAIRAKEHASADLTNALARCLKDKDATLRVSAAEALAVREGDAAKRAAAKALVGRLSSVPRGDDSWLEKKTVLQALHDLARPETVKPILDGIDHETKADEVELRCMAVANVPHASAVESLIRLGSSGRNRKGEGRNWGRAVVNALRYATGHDEKRRDPDAWRAWWKEAKKTFDFEQAAADRAADRAEKERKALEAEEKKRKREERKNRKKKGKGKKEDGSGDDA